MTDKILTTRVVHDHVAGPDALIVYLTLEPWGKTEFGLTFEQALRLANHLYDAVASFEED